MALHIDPFALHISITNNGESVRQISHSTASSRVLGRPQSWVHILERIGPGTYHDYFLRPKRKLTGISWVIFQFRVQRSCRIITRIAKPPIKSPGTSTRGSSNRWTTVPIRLRIRSSVNTGVGGDGCRGSRHQLPEEFDGQDEEEGRHDEPRHDQHQYL